MEEFLKKQVRLLMKRVPSSVSGRAEPADAVGGRAEPAQDEKHQWRVVPVDNVFVFPVPRLLYESRSDALGR